MLNWYSPKSKEEEKPVAEKGPPPRPYLLQFFSYEHLPKHLQDISKPFRELAEIIAMATPCNPEQEQALRKLLEAKDCAVRSYLMFRIPDSGGAGGPGYTRTTGAGGGVAK